MANNNVSIQMCFLALICGIVASGVIITFKVLVDQSQELLLTNSDEFTSIDTQWRVLLPILGATLIFLLMKFSPLRYRRLGIAYVIHRIKHHNGIFPKLSAPAQFYHAFIALLCGFSVGREGPAIHLGAATASAVTWPLNLPHNAIRIVAASGAAAGISAIFNTPLAAIIFVIEVITREYRLHYVFPIVIAAMCGTLANSMVFGDSNAFTDFSYQVIPIEQYPLLIIFGLVLGVVGASFNHSLLWLTKKSLQISLARRLASAALVTAVIGIIAPQALGTGENLLEYITQANTIIWFAIMVCAAKIIATIAAIGLGIPGGLIGPLYGIGALVGGIFAWTVHQFSPIEPYIVMYALIGMAAMMAIGLSAPLAALAALVELTGHEEIISPALFVIIPGFLLSYQVLKARSIMYTQLDIWGLSYRQSPTEKELQKQAAMAIMNTMPTIDADLTEQQQCYRLIKDEDNFLLINQQGESQSIPRLNINSTLDKVYKATHKNNKWAVLIEDKQGPVGIIYKDQIQEIIRKPQL